MQNIAEKPLAIVGMACRLPGAENLDEFWKLLIEGRSNLGELPPERFNHHLHFHPEKGRRNKSYSSIGGVVPSKPFDHAESIAGPVPQLPIPTRCGRTTRAAVPVGHNQTQ